MQHLDFDQIRSDYINSTRRLFLLDYEGTLVPVNSTDPVPSTLEPLNELLFQLSSESINQVVVLSDRTKEELNDWFNHLPLILVAESGGFFRTLKNQWQSHFKGTLQWKDHISRALRSLTHQYQGSFIETKHFSVAWNHAAINRIPKEELRQFQVALRSLARTHGIDVHEGSESIEFASSGVTKGKFASAWVSSHGNYDFILAMGNDWKDENLFDTIGKEYYTIRIGFSLSSSARYYLDSQDEVNSFLKRLTNPQVGTSPGALNPVL